MGSGYIWASKESVLPHYLAYPNPYPYPIPLQLLNTP